MRMDRYKDTNDQEINDNEGSKYKVLSRESKNQDIYNDIYMNNSVVDLDHIFKKEEVNDSLPIQEEVVEVEEYVQKSYDVKDYLEKAHEMHQADDAQRNLNDQQFIEGEDAIRKLIADIEEKEQDEDIFSDLRGENEDTMIGAKQKTDEFDTNVFKTLLEDASETENMFLEHVLGDKTVCDLQTEKEQDIDKTFEEIIRSDAVSSKKSKKLPWIIFLITLVTLIAVIIIILLKK